MNNPFPPPPSFYVQTARPFEVINTKFAEFASDRDQELIRIQSESEKTIRNVRFFLLILNSLALGVMLLGSLFFINRGLSPVNRLSQAVSQVSEKDFRLPIDQNELSVELLPVHQRLSTSLAALGRAFEQEKRAIADISHELRTPVASLAATIDVCLRKPRTADQYKTALEECRDINRQLGRLVERVMTLANLDAGNDRSIDLTINPAVLAQECLMLIRPLAETKGLTINSDLPKDCQLTTDVDKVREVLMNFLHNAVEYTPSGGIVNVNVKQGAKGEVTFEVRDTGIGMSGEVQSKIFDRFYRADASRTTTGLHAGLGLSIVKEYANRLGATIEVESEQDKGSAFRIIVPNIG
jgi:two-component system, OmpR family, heavy metal sensor histidine kinase CusS